MPSSTTPNYQLNQWSADDQVRRVDFNADNAKIDAAIKAVDTKADTKADQTALAAEVSAREAEAQARASGDAALSGRVTTLEDKATMHHIKTATMNADAASFVVPLNDIDWSQWSRVYVYLKPQGEKMFTLTFGTTKSDLGLYPPEVYLLLLFPTHRPYLRSSGIFFCGGASQFLGSNHKYEALPNMSLNCWYDGDVLKAGTAVEFYGEK